MIIKSFSEFVSIFRNFQFISSFFFFFFFFFVFALKVYIILTHSYTISYDSSIIKSKTSLTIIKKMLPTVDIYLFQINDGNTREMREIPSKLAIKTPEWRHWRLSGVFIVNLEQIFHIFLVFPLFTLNK